MSKRYAQPIWLLLGMLFAISFFAVSVNQGSAAPSGLPTRPTDSPTATPTVTPTAPTATPVPVKPIVYGAYIQLQLSGSYNPAHLWTIVQWQDTNGGWHNVDGWQGTLDDGSSKTWWVAPEDFGTGPFRWVAYATKGGQLLASSSSFDLPDQTKEIVLVTLQITP